MFGNMGKFGLYPLTYNKEIQSWHHPVMMIYEANELKNLANLTSLAGVARLYAAGL